RRRGSNLRARAACVDGLRFALRRPASAGGTKVQLSACAVDVVLEPAYSVSARIVAMNIIELIENRLDDRFIDAAASETGLSPDETRTASRAAVPALLAGLLGAITKPGGTKALGSMLKQGLLGDGSPIAGATAARSTAGSGIGSVTSLLGEGKLSSLINAIGGFSGIGHSQSRSLIGMVVPVVNDDLGRDQRGGTRRPEGIARLLGSQKREIADAIPASVASSLRSAGMLDALEEEPQRPRTAASTRTAESARRHTTETPRPVERKR